MTKYLILERIGGLSEVERYATLGQAEAHGPMQAIKAVTASRDLPESDVQEFFVAVPLRNWTAVAKSVKRQDPVVSYVELPTLDGTSTAESVELTDEGAAALSLVDGDAAEGDATGDGDATDDGEPEPDEPEAAAS